MQDQIDVAIFEATQADPVAALVAAWETARIKINLSRRTPLYAPGTSAVVYCDPVRWETDKEFWNRVQIDSRFILEGCDIDDSVGGAAAQHLRNSGIGGCAGDDGKRSGEELIT